VGTSLGNATETARAAGKGAGTSGEEAGASDWSRGTTMSEAHFPFANRYNAIFCYLGTGPEPSGKIALFTIGHQVGLPSRTNRPDFLR
jgi:hypothetical protein